MMDVPAIESRLRMRLQDLLVEYDRALAYTDGLFRDLTVEEVHWRPSPDSSAIGWHLGHQPAVAHFMVRNLTAAEPSFDSGLDRLMDAATTEPDRGDLPGLDRLVRYRDDVAERVRFRVGNIDRGDVGAPDQLKRIAENMLIAIINHEYQHSKWVGEVRTEQFGHALPDSPLSDLVTEVEGYFMVE